MATHQQHIYKLHERIAAVWEAVNQRVIDVASSCLCESQKGTFLTFV